ncbi:hypothetical protein JZ751_008824, partial [Albula glossodonta]
MHSKGGGILVAMETGGGDAPDEGSQRGVAGAWGGARRFLYAFLFVLFGVDIVLSSVGSEEQGVFSVFQAPSSYLSFVTGAILWDRGLYHYTDSSLPDGPPSLCHRFLAHMNASPGDLRPPRFLSGYPRPMVPQLGQAQRRQAQSAPRIHRYAGKV